MDRKEINQLVKLYFDFNPSMNRGIGFKSKANDIITSYANKLNKNFEEIKECIESSPDCQFPIWTQFDNFFNKKKVEKKSHYKDSINNSINPSDWL